MVPVTLYFSDGSVARPKDILPILGHKAHAAALKSIGSLGKQLRTSLTECAHLLPESLFPEQGHEKRYLERQISDFAGSLYIRTVDKGAGQVWGFCQWWVWGVLEEVVTSEGYVPTTATPHQVKANIRRLI